VIKERILEILEKQNAKGLATYGHTLDDCPMDKYDWNHMALEELIDALQYMIKENLRLRHPEQTEGHTEQKQTLTFKELQSRLDMTQETYRQLVDDYEHLKAEFNAIHDEKWELQNQIKRLIAEQEELKAQAERERADRIAYQGKVQAYAVALKAAL
jgi:chromosome segregation ATPase